MPQVCSALEALDQLAPAPRFVVLMCGLAGSGKTTFSLRLETQGFIRVGIDELIWNVAGRYGIDYPPESYGEKLASARTQLKTEVESLLASGKSIVVDSAFWNRAHRDEFISLVTSHGGRHRIVYLKATKATLEDRLAQRKARFDANAALPIDGQTLERFIESFEEPSAEENALVIVG